MRAMTYDNSRRISNISPQYNNNNSPHNYSLRRHGMSSWFLFIVGCCLGHWHGRFFTASVEHGVLVLLHNNGNSASDRSLATTTSLPPSSLLPSRNNNDCLRPDGNGWRTIQVFYGKDKPLHDNSTIPDMNYDLSSPASTTTTTTERKSASPLVQRERQQQQGSSGQQQRWYSQARQDELVIALLRNQTNGYFVDLAANDAVQFSNTYAMEKFYNWKGVCIEPNPAYWHNLTLHRTCAIIGAVVGAQRMQEVFFRFEAGDHGGIADEGFDNGKRWQRSSELRYTVPLLEILRERTRAPPVIDYLSLDVEGAETFIMQNFPLDQYRIKIITAERLRGDIRGYLKSHGYQFVQRLTKWGESLWVHDSVRDELDWSIIGRFNFPL